MKTFWKTIASIGICAIAVYGEVNGVRYLFVGAVVICMCMW